uniref:small monomeric GTPase n=1 Tax=Periophthalmus magnuspinnatus TaxID=409849 RepID=A0A3B4BLV2_9GOBI
NRTVGTGTTGLYRDAADQNFDYMFKLLIIGNSSVGKTSFLFRYADDSFTPAFISTVGIDFKVKTIYRNDKKVKLQIWVRGKNTKILFYDRKKGFMFVFPRATQIKTYSWDNAQVVLVGNKLDLEEDRQVPTEDARRLATELGFLFFEASAKDNINVKQVFDSLVDVICEKMNVNVNGDAGNTSANLNPDPNRGSQTDCACHKYNNTVNVSLR